MLEKSIQPYPEYRIQIPNYFAGIFDQMRESIDRMRPFLEQAALVQKRTNEALAPIRQSMDTLRSVMGPISESFAATQKIVELVKPLAI